MLEQRSAIIGMLVDFYNEKIRGYAVVLIVDSNDVLNSHGLYASLLFTLTNIIDYNTIVIDNTKSLWILTHDDNEVSVIKIIAADNLFAHKEYEVATFRHYFENKAPIIAAQLVETSSDYKMRLSYANVVAQQEGPYSDEDIFAGIDDLRETLFSTVDETDGYEPEETIYVA